MALQTLILLALVAIAFVSICVIIGSWRVFLRKLLPSTTTAAELAFISEFSYTNISQQALLKAYDYLRSLSLPEVETIVPESSLYIDLKIGHQHGVTLDLVIDDLLDIVCGYGDNERDPEIVRNLATVTDLMNYLSSKCQDAGRLPRR